MDVALRWRSTSPTGATLFDFWRDELAVEPTRPEHFTATRRGFAVARSIRSPELSMDWLSVLTDEPIPGASVLALSIGAHLREFEVVMQRAGPGPESSQNSRTADRTPLMNQPPAESPLAPDSGRNQKDEASAFGRSLHVDFYGVAPAICDDLGFCYSILEDLTDRLGMHKQSPPFLFRSPASEFPDKAGLSGWVPLIESGISIHTLTVTGFVSVDIYTCGDLDVEDAVRFLSERLRSSTYEKHYLVRGMAYYA